MNNEILYKKPKVNDKFDSVWSNYLASAQNTMENYDFASKRERSNKCNQCDYACSDPSALRSHLKKHSGQKSNKCNP